MCPIEWSECAITAANVEKLRAYCTAWEMGTEPDLGLLDPEVVFEDDILPDHAGEIYRGHAGLVRATRTWLQPYEEFTIELDEILGSGDRLVSTHRFLATARHTGIRTELRYAYVWTFRDARTRAEVQPALHRKHQGRKQAYDRDAAGRFRGRQAKRPGNSPIMDTARRGNYESGSDYVLEYGELRFTFNERDFTERVEQAACKLGFVGGSLGDDEREDLVNLAVNGEVTEPHSDLGEHINECWSDLNGPSERSLVHWIRRLVFRGAWLDQRVMEGELEVVFDEEHSSFGYAQPDRNFELIELSPEPSWRRVAYRR